MVNEDSSPAPIGAGSRIAGYLLEEQIGQGGMAAVFRAYDDRLNRQVALKVMAPALAADEAFRQRFIRESQAAAAVDDPHVIPVFEAGDADGVLFIAMRYVRGGDVRSLLAGLGQLALARAAEIVAQVASGLDAAHSQGLVHRDVKPANMLLDAAGGADGADHVYLSDFGLSKDALAASGLTGTGQFLGTLDYIAPEQIEGKPVDGRTDGYALACAAFELLTGEPPFRRDGAIKVMYAQLHEPPPAPASLRTDLPPAADSVFARALAKSPADRYPTCREFAEALRDALGLVANDSRAPARAAIPAAHPPTEIASAPVRLTEDAGPRTRAAAWPRRPSDPGWLMAGSQPGQPGRRPAPAYLIGISILVAAGIVGAAIIASSPGGKAGVSAAGNGLATPVSRQPAPGTGSTGPSCRPSAGTSCSSRPLTPGAPGYQLAGTLDPGTAGSMSSVTWTPDSALAATGDQDGSVYLWDVATGKLRGNPFTAAGCEKVFAAAISPDGKTLAGGCKNGSAYLWNIATGQLIIRLEDPDSGEINSVAFSPDGTTLATADGNGYTYLWDAASGNLTTSLADPAGPGIAIWSAVFSSQGMLATGDFSGNVYLWSSGSVAQSFAMPDAATNVPVTALAFNDSGNLLAASDHGGSTYLWSVSGESGRPVSSPAGYPIWALSFNRDGLLAMADDDQKTYLWNVNDASLNATLAATLADPASGPQGVGALSFSPSGTRLVTGDTNGRAYSWKLG